MPRGGPKGSPEDPLADPFDDPSYGFRFRTSNYQRREDADRAGRVNGKMSHTLIAYSTRIVGVLTIVYRSGLYSYLDDVGERHSVRYAAGAGTGYQVSNAVPDTPSLVKYSAPLYKSSRGARGKVSYERGPGGQYKFIASAPDQRRSESTGADGITRGSYSYLDDKGLQRTVEYIAGAGIGYKIVQSSTGPGSHLNARPAIPQFGPASAQSNDITDADGSGFRRTESGSFGSRRTGQAGSATGQSGGQAGFGSSSGFGSGSGNKYGSSGSAAAGGIGDYGGGSGGSSEKGLSTGFGAGSRAGASGGNSWDKAGRPGSGSTPPIGGGSSESHRGTGVGSGSYGSGQRVGDSARGGANRYGGGAETYGGSSDGIGGAAGSQTGSGAGRYGAGGSSEAHSGIGQGSGSGGDFTQTSSERDHLHSSGNRQSSVAGSSGASRPSSGGSAGSSSVRGSAGVHTGSGSAGSVDGTSYVTSNDASLSIDRNRDWTTGGRDSTIVKNVGKWYVGLPPGSAVRAHVQNIDLLPIGGRPPSPSEALRKDVQRSRHFDSYDD